MEELDVEIEFPRFPKEKQDQIRQLVAYVTLMGLDGKDLVSIGGKLDRLKAKNEIMRNRAVIDNMLKEKVIVTVGKDKDMRSRWAYITPAGRYYFSNADWYGVKIVNSKTGVQKSLPVVNFYNFGRYRVGNNRELANVMLNVYHGDIPLNF